MKKKILLITITFFTLNSLAQPQAWNWYFGDNAAINFSSGVPLPVSGSAIHAGEGCATISDNNGNLLFYTDGVSVWNRNNIIMPNGIGLFGIGTPTQAALIVPKPDSSNIYYIFTADDLAGSHGINYSEVDMTLNSGFGDVTVKNIQLLTHATEKLCGVRNCNGTDFWVIAHGWNDNSYYSYPVTSSGVGIPVISNIGSIIDSVYKCAGYLKASPNGKKLAAAISQLDIVEIYDFDNAIGIITNSITIPGTGDDTYGVSFSPDNSKLYVTGVGGNTHAFCQFDISSNDQFTIMTSRYIIALPSYSSALQLGPDNKLYTPESSFYLSVINSPNVSGAGCDYVRYGFYLDSSSTFSSLGLPNFIDYAHPVTFNLDTSVCFSPFTLIPTALGQNYLWSTCETTQNISVSNDGTYWVQVYGVNACNYDLVDTIHLSFYPFSLDLGNDTTLCSVTPLTLNAGNPGGTYLWSTGATTQTITVTTSNNYWVYVHNYGSCSGTDIITVNFLPTPIVNLGSNIQACVGDTITLNAGNPGNTYLWSTGETTQTINVVSTSNYWVYVDNGTCNDMDTTTVTFLNYPIVNLGPDTNRCWSPTILLNAQNTGSVFHWSTGATNQIIQITTSGTYWIMVSNGSCTASDTVLYNIINYPPNINLGNDTTICNNQPITLNAGGNDSTYLWSTGETTQTITVATSGTITVHACNETCCRMDTIHITAIPVPLPIVSFSVDTITGCKPLIIQLTNTTTGADSYWWHFSDGGTSTLTNPVHSYSHSGNYTITLVAYDTTACGIISDSSVQTFYFTVYDPPAIPIITVQGDSLISNFITGNQWFKDTTSIPGATNQTYIVLTNACYYVEETDTNGCKSKSDSVCFTTGINEINNHQGISIFPNPSNTIINLHQSSPSPQSIFLSITDVYGRVVYKEMLTGPETKIDVSKWSPGVYIYSLKPDNLKGEVWRGKIIKEE